MADLDGDDMCRCGSVCTCGGGDWGEEYEEQDCPDDAPDGRCWDCRARRTEPHRADCKVRNG